MITPNLKYSGEAPGADSDTYSIFNSVDAGWPAAWAAMHGLRRFVAKFHHSGDFTATWYSSPDRGTTWYQDGTQDVTAGDDATVIDFLIEGSRDFKLEITNAGVAQDPWDVSMHAADDRSVAD